MFFIHAVIRSYGGRDIKVFAVEDNKALIKMSVFLVNHWNILSICPGWSRVHTAQTVNEQSAGLNCESPGSSMFLHSWVMKPKSRHCCFRLRDKKSKHRRRYCSICKSTTIVKCVIDTTTKIQIEMSDCSSDLIIHVWVCVLSDSLQKDKETEINRWI